MEYTTKACAPQRDNAARQADAAVATPVHFVEENFDPDYEWNEWKLRQQALSLADIRRTASWNPLFCAKASLFASAPKMWTVRS